MTMLVQGSRLHYCDVVLGVIHRDCWTQTSMRRRL